MSPLEKMIIQALENEDDDIILAEVLDFYEYLKEKKKRQKDTLWKNIQEECFSCSFIRMYNWSKMGV